MRKIIILFLILLLFSCGWNVTSEYKISTIEISTNSNYKYYIEARKMTNDEKVIYGNYIFFFTNKEYRIGDILVISKKIEEEEVNYE